jgi:hypothetical protein
MQPWNHWYHCTLHTYGTWLRGDPRGWRARHHREHVDGDYRNPPPKGRYDSLHAYSKSLMKRDAVEIDDRAIIEYVLRALLDRLQEYHTPVAIGSFDGVHAHLLMQCLTRPPRILVGIAKQYATAQLKAHGSAVGFDLNLQEGEGIWGKRSHPVPITDPDHYGNAFDYIRKHERKGAIVITPDFAEIIEP